MTTTRPWMDRATEQFLRAVDNLDGQTWELEQLPGWRPREIVAHVHHNAEAIGNLATWAATGIETPMYPSREQRDEDIRVTAQLPVDELRGLVRRSAVELSAQLDDLDEGDWGRTVRTTQGLGVPATEIVWMRTREVAIHGVDLGAGLRFADFPDELLVALIDDVVKLRVTRGEAPTIAAWLTGRDAGEAGLGPWL